MREINNKLSGKSKLNNLVIMNIAPLTGKRDAAYDCASQMLSTDFLRLEREHRDNFYERVIELIELALECSNIISSATSEMHCSVKECNFSQYVRILGDTVKAAGSLARHEMALFANEPVLTAVAAKKAAKDQLRKADEVFYESEKNIVQCIHELLRKSESRIKSYRRHSQRVFSSSEHHRYKKSYQQFTQLAEEKNIIL